MGTIVTSKTGMLLAELVHVGDLYCGWRGGMPGCSVVMPKKEAPQAQAPSKAERPRRLQDWSLEETSESHLTFWISFFVCSIHSRLFTTLGTCIACAEAACLAALLSC
jgi:hypothetical protein